MKVWIWIVVWVGCASPKTPQHPIIRALPNGLRVILLPDSHSPLVNIVTVVHSGSADENWKISGVSHFLEHLILFRGTAHRSGQAIQDSMRSWGAYFNGHTSQDWTTFEISVPAEAFRQSLSLHHEMVLHAAIESDGVHGERGAILEELQRYEDHPVNVAYAATLSAIHRGHGYALPVLGTRESVQSISAADVDSFYAIHYVPANMTLVVTGNIDTDSAWTTLTDLYTESGVAPVRAAINPDTISAATLTIHKNIHQAVLMWGAPGPPASSEDIPAVDLLLTVLGTGENSILHQTLRSQTNWVNEVQVDLTKRKLGSMIYLYAGLDPRNELPVREAVRTILDSLGNSELPEWEIARVKNHLRTLYEKEMEGGLARAMAIGQNDVSADYSFALTYPTRLQQVTASQLQEVAKKYFRSDRFHVTRVVP